jgi:hypothetical protein
MSALQQVRDFVQSTITARKDATGPRIQTFRSKVSSRSAANIPTWSLNISSSGISIPRRSTHSYLFHRSSATRACAGNLHIRRHFNLWNNGSFTPIPTRIYLTFIECHLAPPLAVIKGGPNCAGIDLDVIARASRQMNESPEALYIRKSERVH